MVRSDVSGNGESRSACVARGRNRQARRRKGIEVAIISVVPACGAPIAPLVGSDDMEPRGCKGCHHLSPGVGKLREAVEKQDARPTFTLEAGL